MRLRALVTAAAGALALAAAAPVAVSAQEAPTPEMQVFWALQDYCVAVDGDRVQAIAAADADGMWKPRRGAMDDAPFANADIRYSPSELGYFVMVGDIVDEAGVQSATLCGVGVGEGGMNAARLGELANAWLGGHGGNLSEDENSKMFGYLVVDGVRRPLTDDISEAEAERLMAEGHFRMIVIESNDAGAHLVALVKPTAAFGSFGGGQ